MRLFVAINAPRATLDGLVGLQDALRAKGARGNFSRLENLHITLAFLGEYDDAEANQAAAAVEALSFSPFELSVDRVDGGSHGRDLWFAGITESQPLKALQRALTKELDARGCPYDGRSYRPHITLAREVVTSAQPWPVEPFAWPVTRVDLMRSQRIDGRLTYTSMRAKLAG